MLLLNEKLAFYSKKYFQENVSEISDFEYDVLWNQLKDLEKKFPQYKNYTSIVDQVGYESSKVFPPFNHPLPMNSLNKAMDQEEFVHFVKERERNLQERISDFFLSLKLDGLALELVYKDGDLLVGATRGDGVVGENITPNVKMIENVPKTIKKVSPAQDELVIIRGEAFFFKRDFAKINEELKKNDESTFANARNAVSGTMRQLDSKIVEARKVVFLLMSSPTSRTFCIWMKS